MTRTDRIGGSIAAAGALLVLGMLLLGIPGMAVLEFVGPLAGPRGLAAFHGDKAWPAGIAVTEIMPFGVVASAVALAALKPDTRILASTLWGLLGYAAAGVAAAVVLVAID